MSTVGKLILPLVVLLAAACSRPPEVDLLIRNGTIYDGSGDSGFVGDLAVDGDRIVDVGELPGPLRAAVEIDAEGLAVAPGFINMLSWANTTLLVDGRGLSDVSQGVTLEVFGEGLSMGPLTEEMKVEMVERQGDLRFNVEWTTLGEYLDYLVERGVAPNVASFVGATTVRIHELGHEDRAPMPEELERMKSLVHQAMREGALGVGSSLIYAPAFFADTEELVALATVAGEYGGMYISHIRDEGEGLLDALEEFLAIVERTGVRGEIYHLKANREQNWGKLEEAISLIEQARKRGLAITADVYPYAASATGLSARMPPWVREGGHEAWMKRLQDPATRARVREEMTLIAPERVLLVGFRSEELKPLTGKTLAEVAAMRGTSPEDTVIDLIIEDDSRIGTVYFGMSEENVRKKIALPWVAFGSDAGAPAPEGVFLLSGSHPRAYGTFARILGKFVREEGVVPLAEALRRMTSLPAGNLGLEDRGELAPGYFADIVVFDPAEIRDHATYRRPHQLSSGVIHVFVNGVQVLADGAHTGARPGRVVRGPGWTGD
ncbi:MAG: D-aminoacylase [Acidobacteria bacterium]|nr:MAG: D-aminoacylase [Acidobacteriota bacterium]